MIPIAKPLVGEEEIGRVAEAMRSGQLTHGPVVEEFERALASYCGYKHAVAVNSGTAALHVSLLALGVSAKDKVVVPDFSFIATANAAKYVGAKISFSDIDKKTFNIDAKKAAKKMKGAKAAIPVSLYGQAYDVAGLLEAAKAEGTAVISDNCQAIGAKWMGKRNFGDDCATLSFYPTKNMTTGEGGAILTDRDDVAEKSRIIRNVGMRARYEYLYVGYNYRMTSIAAAIGIEQLKKLDSFTEKRRKNAQILTELLTKVKQIDTPFVDDRCFHVFHQYTIRAKDRDGLKKHLDSLQVGNAVFYPMPLHAIPILGAKAKCPAAEKASAEVISLPVHPALAEEDLHKVADAVKSFYSKA